MSLLAVVQQDLGNRGIGKFAEISSSDFLGAVKYLQEASRIAIITGFNLPPQETDGPNGALALARALQTEGKEPVLVIPSFAFDILTACSEASIKSYGHSAFPVEKLDAESLQDAETLTMILHDRYQFDAVVSIEVVGPSRDGKMYRMSGADCTEHQGYIYRFFEILSKSVRSISVADGGNELGCGRYMEFLQSEDCKIPRIKQIACSIPCDALVVAGVSNWGAYALALAIGKEYRTTVLGFDQEKLILEAAVKAGAGDPGFGSNIYVDRMRFDEEHRIIIEKLLEVKKSPIWGSNP
jgi:D-glutamate cyclase